MQLLVLLGFVALGLLQSKPLLAHPRSETISGGNGDIAIFLFFLSNTSHSLLHGHLSNVLVAHTLNAPLGVNSMWNTTLLLPSVLLTPVTAVAGPVLSMNLILIFGPALSGWSAFLCSGRFLKRVSSRVVAGVIFGFSPGIMAANLGHYHLTLLMFVPPILMLTVDAVTGRRRPLVSGVLIGLCVTCQLMVGEEVLALAGVTVGVLLVLLAAQCRSLVRERLTPLLVTTGWIALTTLLTAGPFLAVQFFGPQHVQGAVSAPDRLVLDPTGLVLPSPGVKLQTSGLSSVLSTSPLAQSERMGYLGLPLVLLLIAVVVRNRRDLVTRTTALTAGVLSIFALGFTLHLNGNATGIPMPWKLTDGLPLLGNVLPVRWMLIVYLMVALLVGVAVEAVSTLKVTARGRGAAWGVIALCLLPLLPRLSGAGSPINTPEWFLTAGQRVTSPVLVVPMPHPSYSQAMTWSAMAGTRFPIVGGYFIGPHAGGVGGFGPYPIRPTAHALDLMSITGIPVQVSRGVRLRAREDFAYWGVRTVVLGPSSREQLFLDFFTKLLGMPKRTGGVWLWDGLDPARLRAAVPVGDTGLEPVTSRV